MKETDAVSETQKKHQTTDNVIYLYNESAIAQTFRESYLTVTSPLNPS
jgi:hypothetical protein